MSGYVELHGRSAFSFLRAASQPEEMARQAAELGMSTMALCDRDGVYGSPRFYAAAREAGMKAIVGAELTLEDGSVLPVLVKNRVGYRNLCRLITQAKLRGTKHEAPVAWSDMAPFAEGLLCLTGDEEGGVRRALSAGDRAAAEAYTQRLCSVFGSENVQVEIQRHRRRGEAVVNDLLLQLAGHLRLPLVATNGPLYALRKQRPALDVLTCIRHHTHLDAAGLLLEANGERYLKPAAQMEALFADLPEALAQSGRIAERLEFSLQDLGYEFPRYPVPEGETMESFLRQMTYAGARVRYGRLTRETTAQLERELTLICQLGFAGYFLIVWDIANFCVENDILMQGRGSAANSAVCYSLGITACDPLANNLLFERFLSEGRTSWPDIDLDLPSGERRERVIQELYQRYGQHGAAMTANVIPYRGKSAMREIGKALHLPEDMLSRFSALYSSGDYPHTLELQAHLVQAGLPMEHPRNAAFARLYPMLYGLPRHLGQHSGGMIICQGQLDAIVPLERASMPGRVVAQWDKDDCEDLGIIKVDLLGLGMMAVLQESLQLCQESGRPVELTQIPRDDAAVFDLLQRADTIGVFQVESRAQMATLPRMKPACFYDIVIEVAIIRPGPIQGDLVHPYLNRRAGREAIDTIHPLLEPVLRRTLGVPLFQEQVLKMAMIIADFSGAEAEELRRAMSFHRSHERMNRVTIKLRAAMERKGISEVVIGKFIKSVTSFALYGFPESHAISFANLVWASSWLKVHRPLEFFAGLFNNQPMGFYSTATLLRDARRHGVRFRPVSVIHSGWRCTLELPHTLRLGLCMVRGLSASSAHSLLKAREEQPFASLEDLRRRTSIARDELRVLASIGALNGLVEHRRAALWAVEESLLDEGDLFASLPEEQGVPLAPMAMDERINADFRGTGLTIGPHPMVLLRREIPELADAWPACELPYARDGSTVSIAGNIICRQRPGTAKGFVFISLEDETGVSNAIVTPQLFERMRLLISQERYLIISGRIQNRDNVILLKAQQIRRLPTLKEMRGSESHDFH